MQNKQPSSDPKSLTNPNVRVGLRAGAIGLSGRTDFTATLLSEVDSNTSK